MKSNAITSWLIALFLMQSPAIFSQDTALNRVITDPELNSEILYGYCDRSGLEGPVFGSAFQNYYQVYEPDKDVIGKMKGKLDGVSIMIVMGTWCSDSEEQVPKFFKVLDRIRFNEKHLSIVCVSRYKEAGEIDLKRYDIQRVPTFIVFRNEKEVGRIIETPFMTLEKDLLLLLTD